MPRTVRRLAAVGVTHALILIAAPLAGAVAPGVPFETAAAFTIETALAEAVHGLGINTRSCALEQDPRQRPVRAAASQRRRPGRMFGWLWRATRNIDIERSGAPVLFYLRSPLLTALPERECPHELLPDEPEEPATCASLAVNAGSEDAYSVAIVLPQLAARSPARLGDTVRGRLERGSSVTLRAVGGAEIEFSPDRVRQIEVRGCTVDA